MANKLMIVGRMGSGKDLVCGYLKEELGYHQFALGDRVKYLAYPHLFHNTDRTNWFVKGFIDYYCSFLTHEQKVKLFYGIQSVYSKIHLTQSVDSPKNRPLLQDIGQVARAIDPNIWIKILDMVIDNFEFENPTAPIVISDIRFKNEYNYFAERGFKGIKLCRNENSRIESLEARDGFVDLSRMNDVSEVEVDEISADFVIENDGTIDDLYESLKYGLVYVGSGTI